MPAHSWKRGSSPRFVELVKELMWVFFEASEKLGKSYYPQNVMKVPNLLILKTGEYNGLLE